MSNLFNSEINILVPFDSLNIRSGPRAGVKQTSDRVASLANNVNLP